MKEEEEEEEEEELCTVIGVAFCSGSVHKDAQITVHNSNIYIYIYIYISHCGISSSSATFRK